METTRRRLLHESNTEGGSIAQEMKSYSRAPVANDGINIYANARINPITSGPFSSQQEIEIPITSSNFDVCEFSNSYIHLKTKLRIRCTNPPVIADTEDNAFKSAIGENQYVMIGLKASPHIVRDYQFKHNNKQCNHLLSTNHSYIRPSRLSLRWRIRSSCSVLTMKCLHSIIHCVESMFQSAIWLLEAAIKQ